MTDEFVIRPLTTQADFRACEDLQREIWQGGQLEVVPLHLLITLAHNGGIVLGAFSPASQATSGETMVGFVFGFLGASEGYGPEAPATVRLKHCSHMLGVRPDWRSRRVGFALKLAQREAARAQALRLMTWTYDPLESRNANLNIAKLGAVCNTYLRDLYGEMDDTLNRGLPSDRFQVDWYIASKRVATRLARVHDGLTPDHFTSAGARVLNPARRASATHLPYPCERPLAPQDSLALVEIPSDFQAIKRASHELASAWRYHTRQLFEAAFEAYYTVIDFVHDAERSWYVLAHTGDEPDQPRWSIFAPDIVGTALDSDT